MPIHFEDLDVVPEVAGLRSALIVPCNMCPAVTVSLREKKPFLQLFKGLLKSIPFDRHVKALQARLKEEGVSTRVFKSILPHHFFACMWTSRRRRQLQRHAKKYEAIIVLGCESAVETVRDSIQSNGCKVVQGMKVVGFTNAKPKFHLPCDISFEDGKIVPISHLRSAPSGS